MEINLINLCCARLNCALRFQVRSGSDDCHDGGVDTSSSPGRAYVWCGETELRFGMQYTLEFSLGKDDAFLTQR